MSKERVFEIVIAPCQEVVPGLAHHRFQPTDSLKELGANSIDRAEIVMMTLESLSLNIPLIEMVKADKHRRAGRHHPCQVLVAPHIVVTGVGVTSAIGQGKAAFLDALLKGTARFDVMRRPGRQCLRVRAAAAKRERPAPASSARRLPTFQVPEPSAAQPAANGFVVRPGRAHDPARGLERRRAWTRSTRRASAWSSAAPTSSRAS